MIRPEDVLSQTFEEILYEGGRSAEKAACISAVEELVRGYLCVGTEREARKIVRSLRDILKIPKITIETAEDGDITYRYIGFPKRKYVLVAMYREIPAETRLRIKS